MKIAAFILAVFCLISPVYAADPLAGSLSVGDTAKDFTLPDAYKYDMNLYDQLKKGPVVLTFYRGGWCPICNVQLHTYQERLEEIEATGAQLIAVSPETPAHAEVTSLKNQLAFMVLSDNGNKIAKDYGIVWQVPEGSRPGFDKWIKKSTKYSLQEFNNHKGHELPVPATFVINTDKKIVYAFKDVDYTKRADINEILKLLKQLK